jgi:hypothetical protein
VSSMPTAARLVEEGYGVSYARALESFERTP